MNFSTRADVDVTGSNPAADYAAEVVEPAPSDVEDVFHASGTRWQFGDVVVSDLLLDAFDDEEKARGRFSYSESRPINFVFVLEGALHVAMEGSTFIFVAGSGAVLPSNELPHFFCAASSRVLVVSLAGPNSVELMKMVPEHPTAIAAAVISTHPALGFLLALVDTVRKHPIKTPPAGVIIAKVLISLLEADQDWHTRPNHPRVAEVESLIDQRYTDPNFDAKALARHLQTSPRDIERVLDEENGGKQVSDLLLDRRIVAAMTLLHPGSPHSAEWIAARCGFPTVGHLEGAIAEVYGLDTKTLLSL